MIIFESLIRIQIAGRDSDKHSNDTSLPNKTAECTRTAATVSSISEEVEDDEEDEEEEEASRCLTFTLARSRFLLWLSINGDREGRL